MTTPGGRLYDLQVQAWHHGGSSTRSARDRGCLPQVQHAPGSMVAAAIAVAGPGARSSTLGASASRSRVVMGDPAGPGSGRRAGRRFGQGAPDCPGQCADAGGGARSTGSGPGRPDQRPPGCSPTVPAYTAGVNPAGRHISTVNWLNSGARTSSASSSGSVARSATGRPPARRTGDRLAPGPRGGPGGTAATRCAAGRAQPGRCRHPGSRRAAAGTARARWPLPGG